ncbi:hypothetical protein [Sediminicoccus sp. BL-A-41-H5]|uniref:hypothetical protein n=1 Tax=Sediminicoccus sp. BL-A-41-H5 TaxID=3421106 RepID=UPI003D66B4A9
MKNHPPAISPIQTAVQVLSFDPGVYSVSFSPERMQDSDIGFSFPRARLDAPTGGEGLVIVALQGENGWLSRPGDVAMVQVAGARMSLLLTTYQIEGANAPALLRVSRLDNAMAVPAPAPEKAITASASGLVHIGAQGDTPFGFDGWAGAALGADGLIEGFSLQPPAGLDPTAIEYQGILGIDWKTPWSKGGEFCGSRGLALPLLGFAIRLQADAAGSYGCTYQARFADGSIIEAADGAPCEASSAAALVAISVSWVARENVAVPPVAPTHEINPPKRTSSASLAKSAVPSSEPTAAKPGASRKSATVPKAIAPKSPSSSAPARQKVAPPSSVSASEISKLKKTSGATRPKSEAPPPKTAAAKAGASKKSAVILPVGDPKSASPSRPAGDKFAPHSSMSPEEIRPSKRGAAAGRSNLVVPSPKPTTSRKAAKISSASAPKSASTRNGRNNTDKLAPKKSAKISATPAPKAKKRSKRP